MAEEPVYSFAPNDEAQNVAARRPNLRARTFAFVVNNPTEESVLTLRDWIQSKPEGYWSCALVVRHSHGNLTPHLHILLSRPQVQRLSTILRGCVTLQRAHFDVVRHPDKMYAYMADARKVVETIVSIGDPGPGQGARSDHVVVFDLIHDQGATRKEIWEAHPDYYMKYHAGVDKACMMASKPRQTDSLTVIVLVGASGTGKSVRARRMIAEFGVSCFKMQYPEGSRTTWWDGYDKQECILMDEFRGQVPVLTMNELVDFGGFRGQVKGSQIEIVADTIIICSNYLPNDWWRYTARKRASLLAFFRRLREHATFYWFLRAEGEVRRDTDGLPTFVQDEDYSLLDGDDVAAEGWFDLPDSERAEDGYEGYDFNRHARNVSSQVF